MPETEFKSVHEILVTDEAEEFRQSRTVTLSKTNKINLIQIIPLSMANHPLFGLNSLCIEVLEENGQRLIVSIDSLCGLTSTEGIEEYEDQLLAEFTYFSPKTGALESSPRRILVTDISFGIHPNHQGEEPDYYIVGEDTQHLDRPRIERIRYFPFWRINGLYGSPEELTSQFIKSHSEAVS